MKRFIVTMFTAVLFMIFQPTMASNVGWYPSGGDVFAMPAMTTLDQTVLTLVTDQLNNEIATATITARCSNCHIRTVIVKAHQINQGVSRTTGRKHRSTFV